MNSTATLEETHEKAQQALGRGCHMAQPGKNRSKYIYYNTGKD